jgi:Tfp pilus assembly protein PilO
MIGAAAAVVVLVVWYVFLWGPRGSELTKAKKRTETAQNLEDQLRTQLARLKAAQQSEPAKRAQLEALREAVPDQPNLAQFLLDTNDSATKAGIDFLSIAPAQPGAGSAQKPATIALSISISGGYFQVLDFVNRLLSAPRLVVISGFNVSAASGAGAGQLSAQITAAMYTTASKGGAAAGTTTTTAAGAAGSTTTTVAGGATVTTIGARP